jgi:SAM-dependent methyltransferase
MTSMPSTAGEFSVYVCPACKGDLRREDDRLYCLHCSQAYPIVEGIPEFLSGELSQSADPELRRMRFIDRMAAIYETRLWYPIVLKVFGGFEAPSLAQLISTISSECQSVDGRFLDVACGPGTYGRRIASPSREVRGIDVSRGMLRQGAAYTAKERIHNMHFARARVESLPFADGRFDGTICCGSLHLFTDTIVALCEMARVMKPGGKLVVFTFTAGRGGILKLQSVRARSRNHGLHLFDLPELERSLAASGFEAFQPKESGSILTFSARKRTVHEA